MTKAFVLYELATGRVLHSGLCADADFASLPQPGQGVVEGIGHEFTHYVSGGVLTAYTPQEVAARENRPVGNWDWDIATKQWVDRRTLNEAKLQKWAQIKRARDAAEAAGFTAATYTFDSDQSALNRLVVAIIRAVSETGAFQVEWTTADNQNIVLNKAQLIALLGAMQDHQQTLRNRAKSRRDQIEAATTVAQVDAITW